MNGSGVWRRPAVMSALAAAMGCPSGAVAQIDMRDEVMYHFMPIAWRDSDQDTNRYGDFGGMEASLDYLEGLGVTAVWMNPIFPSPAYHGYQHGRGDELNPWFGTEAEWVSFVEAAHARGIKVFIDFVVYGISHDSPWFGSAFGNPGSPYDDWLAFVNGANTQYLGAVYNTWNGDSVGFIHWDLRDPDVFDLVADWGKKWLDPNGDGDFSDGVDGYRLDHVWAQYPSGPDGWGYNIDDFWEPWKAELETVNPDVFIFAEQADWGSMGTELLTAFDASMTKPFEFAARSAIASGDASGLYSSMAAAWASVPGDRTFMAIVGDHDVDRLASVVGPQFAKSRVAAAVLLMQPFPPMIYFGDEIGMLGVKGNYGSDANDIPFREPFKWNAVAGGAPMTNYWVENFQAFTNAFSSNNDGRSVEEQEGVSGSILETNRALIAARAGSVALRRGSYVPVAASNPAVWAFVRQHDDQDVLCVINVGGSDLNIELDLSAFELTGGATRPTDLLTGWRPREVDAGNQSSWPLAILANSFYALELELEPLAPPVSGVDGVGMPSEMGAGALVATQDTPTSLGDNLSELNEMYVAVEGDMLRIGLTGNLGTNGEGLCVLFDTGVAGQGVLDFSGYSPPPQVPSLLSGTELDAGFEASAMLFVNAPSGTYYVDWFDLASSGGVTKTYRGQGGVGSGAGLLGGGTNPNGLEVAVDNSNTAGVTGSDASGASTATSGIEVLVPLADLGLTPGVGEVGISAMLVWWDGWVSSQVLPPLGFGAPIDLGFAPSFDSVGGDQFAVVSLAPPGVCVGDVDDDGDTDVFDFNVFAPAFGTSLGDPGYVAAADLDGSETIDVFDFNLFAPDFGCTE